MLAGIKSRAPGARVLVVNYAAILPETGSGCWPQVPFAYSDVPYLRDKQRRLNAMLATQAAAAGVSYVDDYTASIGRDACKSVGHALGRAARARQRRRAVPSQRARDGGHRASGRSGVGLGGSET